MKGVAIPGFKLSKDGKRVEPDFAARDAKLDVSTRLQKRKSRKIKFIKGGSHGAG